MLCLTVLAMLTYSACWSACESNLRKRYLLILEYVQLDELYLSIA